MIPPHPNSAQFQSCIKETRFERWKPEAPCRIFFIPSDMPTPKQKVYFSNVQSKQTFSAVRNMLDSEAHTGINAPCILNGNNVK